MSHRPARQPLTPTVRLYRPLVGASLPVPAVIHLQIWARSGHEEDAHRLLSAVRSGHHDWPLAQAKGQEETQDH